MKASFIGVTALFAMVACSDFLKEDLKADLNVNWSINGFVRRELCADFDIGQWRVTAEGKEFREQTYACGRDWDSGSTFHGIEEGDYDVKIEAFKQGDDPSQGATKAIAQVIKSNIDVSGATKKITIDMFDKHFSTSPTFRGGNLEVWWSINGTWDEKYGAKSWDMCAEVKADQVVIKVNGTEHKVDCQPQDGQKTTIDLTDPPSRVQAWLLNDKGDTITTEAALEGVERFLTEAENLAKWVYWIDFAPATFKDDTITGDYSFGVRYAGKTCADVVPKVGGLAVLLKKEDGTKILTEEVCVAKETMCIATNQTDTFAQCVDLEKPLVIKELPWGKYKLTIEAKEENPTGKPLCWGQIDIAITVGAGTNELITHDLPFVSILQNAEMGGKG